MDVWGGCRHGEGEDVWGGCRHGEGVDVWGGGGCGCMERVRVYREGVDMWGGDVYRGCGCIGREWICMGRV